VTGRAADEELAAAAGSYRVVIGLPSGSLSGVDVFSVQLLRGLRGRGIPAHMLLSRPYRVYNPMALPADIPVVTLPTHKGQDWGERWQIMIRYLESQAPCIYVPNYDYENSCVSPRLSARVGIVGIVHSDDPVHYEHVSRLGRYWDAIVAVTDEIAAMTTARDPSLAARLAVIRYGIAPAPPGPVRAREPGAPLRVIYAGRLDQGQKRVLDLPSIFEHLAARGVPFQLTLAGDGPARSDLERAAAGFLADGRFRMLGTVEHARVLALFEESDVLVLTSAFEGLPLALLEAMSRGCVPVVADVRSGIPGLVEQGVCGYRVPVGEVDQFAERLALLQREPARLRALSVRARQAIAEGEYGADTMVRRYVGLFEQVLDHSRRRVYRRPRGRIAPAPGMDVTWKDHLPLPVRGAGARAKRILRTLLGQRSRARPR
jgi:glycosyltransferase involved in cell wall biosynthesis